MKVGVLLSGAALLAGALAGTALVYPKEAAAQYRWGRSTAAPEREIFPGNKFTFCRVRYSGVGRGGWGGTWAVDYPASDLNFSQRLDELTTIKVSRDERGGYRHVVIELTEEALFDYPFLYMLEVGGLRFSEAERLRLRDYLLRGGFLMVDDFWGEREWRNWVYEIGQVFDPNEFPMKELPLTHPIFNIVFKLNEKPQVPSLNYWAGTGGGTSERGYDSATPHYKGIHDKNGRLMVLVCHNTDLGDGWEREAEHEGYFREISAKKAYPLGINIVVYAMTH